MDAIKLGSEVLPSIDPFAEIEPMDSAYTVQIDIDPAVRSTEYDFTIEEEGKLDSDTDSDSEWEEADDRNAFDIFDA